MAATTCRLEAERTEDNNIAERLIELLEREHVADANGCVACQALHLLRHGTASVVYVPST